MMKEIKERVESISNYEGVLDSLLDKASTAFLAVPGLYEISLQV